jgi:hypothetical protein
MLWVNLLMDTLGSLALATEPPSDDLLLSKPSSRGESLITISMWKHIISQGLLQVVVLGLILFKGDCPDMQGQRPSGYPRQLELQRGLNKLANTTPSSSMSS